VKALSRAHRWKRLLESGRYGSFGELAAERIDRSNPGKTLRLALLAPDIVEAIWDGRQAYSLALPVATDGHLLELDDRVGRGRTFPPNCLGPALRAAARAGVGEAQLEPLGGPQVDLSPKRELLSRPRGGRPAPTNAAERGGASVQQGSDGSSAR
jgi:hypothetical protein